MATPYTITHKTSGNNAADQSSYATSSILVTANKLIIGAFRAGSQPTSVSGGGITWTYYQTVTAGSAHLDIYLGVATSPSSGAITIGYSGTQNECVWTIVEVNITVPAAGVASCIKQFAQNSSTVNVTSITATLPLVFKNAKNVTLGILGTFQNGNITPGSGFTELGESDGIGGSIQSQWLQGQDLTVDWTFGSSVGVVAAAFEIGDNSIAGGGFILKEFV